MEPVVTVGLDGSPESLAAAHWGAAEADRRGLTLRLLHAWILLSPDATGAPSHKDQNYWAKFPGVQVIDVVRLESPARAAVREAQGADLLVIGRRKHRGALAPRLGPVAHSAVHHAACPLAVVPHD